MRKNYRLQTLAMWLNMTGKQNMSRKSCECEYTGHSWLLSIELSMKSTTFSPSGKESPAEDTCMPVLYKARQSWFIIHTRAASFETCCLTVIIVFQSCWQTLYTLGKSTTAIKSGRVMFCPTCELSKWQCKSTFLSLISIFSCRKVVLVGQSPRICCTIKLNSTSVQEVNNMPYQC